MKLYLVQHGDALPKEQDPDWPLSARGIDDVRALAAFLGRAGLSAGRVSHSGKTRARQTAELLAAALAPDSAAAAMDGLSPKDPIEPIAAQVADWQDDVVLVGHLPLMSRIAAGLVSGDEEETIFAFQPGSMVCLERDVAGAWTINWMPRPELFS